MQHWCVMHTNSSAAVVSFDSEPLILVDSEDRIVGYESKQACHQGDGILHRAFSVFIFNDHGQVLLQQRSTQKQLWPGYWSNSCCSHPRQGEEMNEAANRRLHEELGLNSDLKFLYRFQYQASFGEAGSENELCSVYVGRSDDRVVVNVNEISQWRFVSIADLNQELSAHPDQFTPWFKMEWTRLQEEYPNDIESL
jgi:isopentenyl-diphosphate delta-isomerase